jgi:hypothetical protein
VSYRADLYRGSRLAGVRHYNAASTSAAITAAQRDVDSGGLDHADVYEGDSSGRATCVATVYATKGVPR